MYCYYCQLEGHYSSQCSVKTNEKQLVVNMVTTEVANIQQVTTRSKGKTSEWEAQEAIRKQATEWIEKGKRTERDRITRTNETSGGTNRDHGRESNVASITRLPDYTAIGPAITISLSIH